MQAFTFWLMAAAVALILILVILEWSRPRKGRSTATAAESQAVPEPVATTRTTVFAAREPASVSIASVFQARLVAVEQKTAMAHERIQRMEGLLAKIPVEKLGQQLDTLELQKKVERLIGFRNEISLQVAALEQRLEKQKSAPLPAAEQQLDALERELEQQNKILKELENKIPALATIQKRKSKRLVSCSVS